MRDVDQSTAVEGSRLRRLVSRCLLVLGGAVLGTAAAWIVSAGAAYASPCDVAPLGLPSLPTQVTAIATDVAGAGVAGAGENVAGRPPATRHLLPAAVAHVEIAGAVEHLAPAVANGLVRHASSIVTQPALAAAGRMADTGGTRALVIPNASAGRARADWYGDHDRVQRQRYSVSVPHESKALGASVVGPAASAQPVPDDVAPLGPVGPAHIPVGPVAPPASCSSATCHGYGTNAGLVERSAATHACARDMRAPRPLSQWAPLAQGHRPCTTPD